MNYKRDLNDMVDKMCTDKPSRYTQMVKAMVDKANSYLYQVNEQVIEPETIATIMLIVDEKYITHSKGA
jgi:hypothetical protein